MVFWTALHSITRRFLVTPQLGRGILTALLFWKHQIKTLARNEMEGGFTERNVGYSTHLTEPQGKLKK